MWETKMKLFDRLFDRIFGKNKVFAKTEKMITREIRKDDRLIKVRFQSMLGEQDIYMTIHKLKEDYKEYIILDQDTGEKVNIDDLADMNIQEVVARPPSGECC